MALNLGARALDPQVFPAEDERLAVIEGDGQRLAVLVQPQLRWPGCRRCVAHFGLLARRPDRRENRSPKRPAIGRPGLEAEEDLQSAGRLRRKCRCPRRHPWRPPKSVLSDFASLKCRSANSCIRFRASELERRSRALLSRCCSPWPQTAVTSLGGSG